MLRVEINSLPKLLQYPGLTGHFLMNLDLYLSFNEIFCFCSGAYS